MLENKVYDTGMIVGRFQTFHKGHQRLVETGLRLCDRVLILVGSSQECGTERNPLSVATRIDMIRAVYPDADRVIIYPLPDLTHEDDITSAWGRYVLNNADRYIYKAPELMIYGNDEARSRWFDTDDIKDTSEFIINRGSLPISATMLRELMVADARKGWMKHVDAKLHKFYDRIRAELMTVPFYKELHKKLLLSEESSCLLLDTSNGIDTNMMFLPEDLARAKCLSYENGKKEETSIGFDFHGTWITNPFLEESGRFEFENLDKITAYYGKEKVYSFIAEILQRNPIEE